jgi:hypothetical protein
MLGRCGGKTDATVNSNVIMQMIEMDFAAPIGLPFSAKYFDTEFR